MRSQKTNVKNAKRAYSGETSPYWDWVHNQFIVKQNDRGEPEQANPDMLHTGIYDEVDVGVMEQANLIRRGLDLLSEKERLVVETMSEGLSMQKSANKIGMKMATLRNHLQRARKKLQDYVVNNERGGSISTGSEENT